MSKRKLDMEICSAWNTYAVSMMSVLEHCGMWGRTDTFQKFMCETGIAARFVVDETCSPLPVTDYDWIGEHTAFMERIGVQTEKYYAAPQDAVYPGEQKRAVQAVKRAVDDNKGAVVWGIDTGEFGVIYGYDEADKVFFAKGIGSQNTDASLPILYGNLGKTFEYAPILYCEIPKSFDNAKRNPAFTDFLNIYVQEMHRSSDTPERAYGLAAYDMLIRSVEDKSINEFGLRYCAGIYYERKDAIQMYLLEKQKETSGELLLQLIESFGETADLYRKFMFDILQEDTNGWDYLSRPIKEECYPDIKKALLEMKASEERNVAIADKIVQTSKCDLL